MTFEEIMAWINSREMDPSYMFKMEVSQGWIVYSQIGTDDGDVNVRAELDRTGTRKRIERDYAKMVEEEYDEFDIVDNLAYSLKGFTYSTSFWG